MGRDEWRSHPVGDADLSWLVKNLEATPFFNHEVLVEIIAPKFEIHSAPKGTEIVRQGEEGNDVFVIYRGTVSVSTFSLGEVSQLGPGNCFGEMALFVNQGKRAATVTALEDCEFFVLWEKDFRSLLECNPELSEFLSKVARARVSDD